MQKLFDSVTERYRQFVEQDENLLLVSRCPDTEVAYHLRILKAVDETNSTDFFWSFAQEFSQPAVYVEALLEYIARLIRDANETFRQEQLPEWPDVPAFARDVRQDPVRRTQALMVFCRSLLPQKNQRMVWSFFPVRIADRIAWSRYIAAVVHHEVPFPWCHRMRIVARDDAAQPLLAQVVGGAPRVERFAPDLSLDALNGAMEQEAGDPTVPLDRRCQSMLLLANTDYSNRRYHEALEKYQVLLYWYENTGNPQLAAIVMNGIGECHWRMGGHAIAQTWFESSLNQSMDADARPIALNAALNIANMKLERGEWTEAADYYDSAAKLATAQMNSVTAAQCSENRGYCLYQLGRRDEAHAEWYKGAELAQRSGQPEIHASIVRKMSGQV